MIVLALACVIWLEVLYMPFAFVDTEIVHEGVDIFTEALRDCKRTYEWFCQFGAKMFGAIGCRIGSFPNQITHRIFNCPTLRIVVPFRSIPVEPPILLRYKLRSRNWATLLPVTNPECSGV
jgi:hypothetical protein